VNVAVEEHSVEIDGLPIRYLAAGESPPLILLHGAGDNALDWQWIIPTLAATHRVYAPDLPGSPDSASPPPATRQPSSSASWPVFSMLWASKAPRWSATRWAASSPSVWRSPSRSA
jgi:pimeloyl-ACP methyl ester carboxylesterase